MLTGCISEEKRMPQDIIEPGPKREILPAFNPSAATPNIRRTVKPLDKARINPLQAEKSPPICASMAEKETGLSYSARTA